MTHPLVMPIVTCISHRDLKAASHTFLLSLLTARMKHIPGREKGYFLTMKDIRAQVLLALRSRLATANMFLLCYQKCYATGPVAWPKNYLFKFTQSKQGTLDSRNQALLMMAVAGTVSQYEVKGDKHCTTISMHMTMPVIHRGTKLPPRGSQCGRHGVLQGIQQGRCSDVPCMQSHRSKVGMICPLAHITHTSTTSLA